MHKIMWEIDWCKVFNDDEDDDIPLVEICKYFCVKNAQKN